MTRELDPLADVVDSVDGIWVELKLPQHCPHCELGLENRDALDAHLRADHGRTLPISPTGVAPRGPTGRTLPEGELPRGWGRGWR